jgi:hypothetical protein
MLSFSFISLSSPEALLPQSSIVLHHSFLFFFYKNSNKKKDRARWRIIDIPIPQQRLTTLKKEDQGTPKDTQGVT